MQKRLPRRDERDTEQIWGGFKRQLGAPTANEATPG